MIEHSWFIKDLREQQPQWARLLPLFSNEIEIFISTRGFHHKTKFLDFFKKLEEELELQIFENDFLECSQTGIQIINQEIIIII